MPIRIYYRSNVLDTDKYGSMSPYFCVYSIALHFRYVVTVKKVL
jgi:hypothetical protein